MYFATCSRRCCFAPLREHRIHGERDVPLHGEPRHERVALEHDAAIRARRASRACLAADLAARRARAARRWSEISVVLPLPGEADDGDELALPRSRG